MKRKKHNIIAICSSASFYKDVVRIASILEDRGFRVKIPLTADLMKKNNDYTVSHYKTWFKNPRDYAKKTMLMNDHIHKIAGSDAILVVNKTKHGMRGYIGGNVLMEMAIAFYRKKPIYILNDISSRSPFTEEIVGMNSIFIKGDLRRIR